MRAISVLALGIGLFGRGEPESLVSAETADQAAGSSPMLLTLAIGCRARRRWPCAGRADDLGHHTEVDAVRRAPGLRRGLIALMYLSNLASDVLSLATFPAFARLMQVPFAINGPVTAVVCVLGA